MNDFSQDPALLQAFVAESEELLQALDEDLLALESSPSDEELLNKIFRALHSIKGTAGFFGLDPIVRLGHCAEDVLNALRHKEVVLSKEMLEALLAARDRLGEMVADLRAGEFKTEYLTAELVLHLEELAREQGSQAPLPSEAPVADTTSGSVRHGASVNSMRVDVRKLDDLVNLIGELVLERNRLLQLAGDVGHESHADTALSLSAARLSSIIEELQAAGLRTRMVPIDGLFRRFPRLVHDLSGNLGKETALRICGEETEIDKAMIDLLNEPLVHLVRNAVDHGVEVPEKRESAGKSRQGTIVLEAKQEGDQIVVSVADDGAGIDISQVRQRAVKQQILTEEQAARLKENEILELIFVPGFSTAAKATHVSGRGVGMDVVRTNVKKLKGSVEIRTEFGRGTSILIHLPLTLAILQVLRVQVGGEIYAVPLRSVNEVAGYASATRHVVDGCEFVSLRGEMLPLVRLDDVAQDDRTAPGGQKLVVIARGAQRFALPVDRLIGQEATVIKPLQAALHDCAAISGAMVGGDGRVSLVLDPAGLLSSAAQPLTQAAGQ